jgi:hypothetical protein
MRWRVVVKCRSGLGSTRAGQRSMVGARAPRASAMQGVVAIPTQGAGLITHSPFSASSGRSRGAQRAKVSPHSNNAAQTASLAEEERSYHPSDFQAAQRGGGAMRRCRQRRRRRKPRVNSDIRLRATFRRCAPAVFFRQASGSRPHPTYRLTPPSAGPATAPARAGPADRCA